MLAVSAGEFVAILKWGKDATEAKDAPLAVSCALTVTYWLVQCSGSIDQRVAVGKINRSVH